MDSPPHLWDGVLRRLGTETASVALEAWLHPLAVPEESDRLVLLAPTASHRERVRTRFGDRIRSLIGELSGRSLELFIEVGPEAPSDAAADGAARQVQRTGMVLLGIDPYWQNAAIGLIILVSLMIDQLPRRQ